MTQNQFDALFGGAPLNAEQVPEVLMQEPGGYTAALGKVYRKDNVKEGKRPGIMMEFFLWQRTGDDGSENKFMILKNTGTGYTLEFAKNQKGEFLTSGAVFTLYLRDISESDAPSSRGFFSAQRRKIARVFDALDDSKNTVDWEKIRRSAGRMVSFNLFKNDKYINLDVDTLMIYPDQQISLENMKALYDVLESEREKAKTAKSGASAMPKSAPKLKEDDLPF